MRSLKDVRFALDGEDKPTWSLLDTVRFEDNDGVRHPLTWPKLRYEDNGCLSVDEVCRRFSGAGHELRILANEQTNVWAHMNRASIVGQLRRRIRNPGIIKQNPTDFCGPISLIMEFARRRPRRYVRAAAELLSTGVFTTSSGRTFIAAEDLRSRPVPEADNGEPSIKSADWIFAATMRDAENVIDDVDDGQSSTFEWFEGTTWPFELEEWIEDVLDLKADYHPCWFEDEIVELRKGQAAVNAGGVAFLFVDSGIVHPAPDDAEELAWLRDRRFTVSGNAMKGEWKPVVHCEDDAYIYPNHIVVLFDNKEGWNGKTNFQVRLWTYGREFDIYCTYESLGEYLYAVITGTPR